MWAKESISPLSSSFWAALAPWAPNDSLVGFYGVPGLFLLPPSTMLRCESLDLAQEVSPWKSQLFYHPASGLLCMPSLPSFSFSQMPSCITWTFIPDGLPSYITLQCSSQSYPTLCNFMDYNQPGSSVHGVFHTGILEWVAISSSRVSSRPRDGTCVSCISSAGTYWALYHQGKCKPKIVICYVVSRSLGTSFPGDECKPLSR